ncbi:hypothetical protein [Bradyrhizobium sp. USDA 4448]
MSQVDSTHYTATFTAASNTQINNGSVSVDSSWHEGNGNAGAGTTSMPLVIDTQLLQRRTGLPTPRLWAAMSTRPMTRQRRS